MAIVRNSNTQHAKAFWDHVDRVARQVEFDRNRVAQPDSRNLTPRESPQSSPSTTDGSARCAQGSERSE
jgi:hypothetical protein